MSSDIHQFALHFAGLSAQVPSASRGEITITDVDLVGRIAHVLRMAVGQSLVLFDDQRSVSVEIIQITKKAVVVKVISSASVTPLAPSVTMLLPILKREAFEDALYAMTELGVNVVQPITTAKTQTAWGSEKDYQRAQRIFISAAEQSKQFALPKLEKAKTLAEALKIEGQANKIFFDAAGKPMKEVLGIVKSQPTVCLIGPEGDLTQQEKGLVVQTGFVSCALTPTILRAQQAVTLGVGAVRAWVSSLNL